MAEEPKKTEQGQEQPLDRNPDFLALDQGTQKEINFAVNNDRTLTPSFDTERSALDETEQRQKYLEEYQQGVADYDTPADTAPALEIQQRALEIDQDRTAVNEAFSAGAVERAQRGDVYNLRKEGSDLRDLSLPEKFGRYMSVPFEKYRLRENVELGVPDAIYDSYLVPIVDFANPIKPTVSGMVLPSLPSVAKMLPENGYLTRQQADDLRERLVGKAGIIPKELMGEDLPTMLRSPDRLKDQIRLIASRGQALLRNRAARIVETRYLSPLDSDLAFENPENRFLINSMHNLTKVSIGAQRTFREALPTVGDFAVDLAAGAQRQFWTQFGYSRAETGELTLEKAANSYQKWYDKTKEDIERDFGKISQMDESSFAMNLGRGIGQLAIQIPAGAILSPLGLGWTAFALTGAGLGGAMFYQEREQYYINEKGMNAEDAKMSALGDGMFAAGLIYASEQITGGLGRLLQRAPILGDAFINNMQSWAGTVVRGGMRETFQESTDMVMRRSFIQSHTADAEELQRLYGPEFYAQLKEAQLIAFLTGGAGGRMTSSFDLAGMTPVNVGDQIVIYRSENGKLTGTQATVVSDKTTELKDGEINLKDARAESIKSARIVRARIDTYNSIFGPLGDMGIRAVQNTRAMADKTTAMEILRSMKNVDGESLYTQEELAQIEKELDQSFAKAGKKAGGQKRLGLKDIFGSAQEVIPAKAEGLIAAMPKVELMETAPGLGHFLLQSKDGETVKEAIVRAKAMGNQELVNFLESMNNRQYQEFKVLAQESYDRVQTEIDTEVQGNHEAAEVDAAGEFEAASDPSESFTANLNYLQEQLEDYLIENLERDPSSARVEATTIIANMVGKGVVDAEALEIMQEALAQPEDDGAARVKRVEDLRRKIAEDKAAIDRQKASEETEAEPEEEVDEEQSPDDIPMPFSRAEAEGVAEEAVDNAKQEQEGQTPQARTGPDPEVDDPTQKTESVDSDAKGFLKRLRERFGRATKIIDAPNEEAARLQQNLEAAGIKVVFVDETIGDFGGVYIDGTGVLVIHAKSLSGPDAVARFNARYRALIFNNDGTVNPSTALMNAVAAHELSHHLRTQDPKAYKELFKAFLRNDPEGLLNGMAMAILMEPNKFVKAFPDHPISKRIVELQESNPKLLNTLINSSRGRDILQLNEIEARELFKMICQLQADGNKAADLILEETLAYTIESAALRDTDSTQDVFNAMAENSDMVKPKTIFQRVKETLFGVPDDATVWQTRGKWDALFVAFQSARPTGGLPAAPESVRRQRRVEQAASRLQESPFALLIDPKGEKEDASDLVPVPATDNDLFSRIDGLQDAKPDFAIYSRGKSAESTEPLPSLNQIYGRVNKYTRRVNTAQQDQLLKSRDDLIGRTGYAVATLSQDSLVPQAINQYKQNRKPTRNGARSYEDSQNKPATPPFSEGEKFSRPSLEPLDETNRTPDAKVIYFAENARFDSFGSKKNNTSRHHFFTSDLTTAQEAGESVIEYRLNGGVADFTQENRNNIREAQLRQAYTVGSLSSYFDTVEEFVEAFDQGMLHQHLGNSKALDDTVTSLLIVSKSPMVRIPDVGRDGKLVDSYVTSNMPIKYRGEQTGKTFSIHYRVQTKTDTGRKMSEMGMVMIQANDEFEAREEFKRRNKRSDEFKDKMYRTLDSSVTNAMMEGLYPKPRVVISTVSEVDEHSPKYSKTGVDEATRSRNFKNFFKGAAEQFRNEDGSPREFFHGTDAVFEKFDLGFKTAESNDQFGAGFYFTASKKVATSYSRRALSGKMRARGEDPNAAVISGTFPPLQIYKVYLAVKNPMILEQGQNGPELSPKQVRQIVMKGDTTVDGPMSNFGDIEYDGFETVMSGITDAYSGNPNAFYQLAEFFEDQQEYLRALSDATGFDGVYVSGEQGEVAVAFFPEQIKSVDDNSGAFDPNDPRMNFSRFDDIKESSGEKFNEVKSGLKKAFKERILSTRGLPAGVVRKFVEKDGQIDVHADRASKANRRLMSEIRKKFSSREERSNALRAANELLALPPEVARQHPASRLLGQEITEIVADMNNHIQAMSERVMSELGLSDKMKISINENLGFYVHKRYKAFTEPKWAENVPREVKEQFKRVIRAQLREQLELSKKEPRTIIRDGKSVPNPAFRTEEMIEAELDQLVQDILYGAQDGGSVMAFASKLGSGKRTSSIFKKRKLVLIDREAEVDKLQDDHATKRDRLDDSLAKGKISKGTHATKVAKLEAELQAAMEQLTPKKVKEQNDFVEAYKALLGEVEDPISNYAETIKKMSTVLAENRLASAVLSLGKKEGFIFDTPPPGRTDLVKLDFIEGVEFKKRRHMVPLQGKYITKDAKDSLDLMLGRNGGIRDSSVVRMFLTLNASIKFGKTVLSPTTQVRNVVGNIPFLIANGYFELLTGGVPLIQAFKESGITAAVGNDLLSLAGKDRAKFAEKYQRLLELGVVRTSNLAEVETMLEESRGKTLEELMSSLGRVGGVLNSAQRLYKAEDDIFKILAFEIEFSRLKDAYGDDANEAQLETKAAEIVANTMPNYDLVPEIIKSLRVIPFIGTFPSFTAEVIRTQIGRFSQMQSELKSENVKIRNHGKKRLAGNILQGVLLPTLLAEIFKAFSGVSDEEERAVRNMLPEWNRNSVLLFTRDKDGEVTFIDYGYVDPLVYFRKPLIALFNRDTDLDTGVSQALTSIVSPFLGEEIGFGAVKQVFDGRDRNSRTISDPGAGALEQGYDRAMHFLTAAMPGAIPQFRDLYRGATGYVNDYGKRYDFGNQAATMLTGFKTETVNIPQAFGFKVAEFARLDRELRTRMNQVVRTQGQVSESELGRAVENYNDKRHALQVRLFDQVRGMRRLGVSDVGIRRILRGNFISQDLTKDLLKGEFQSYDIKPTLLDRQLEQLKFTDRDVPLTRPGEVQRRLRVLRAASRKLKDRRLDD